MADFRSLQNDLISYGDTSIVLYVEEQSQTERRAMTSLAASFAEGGRPSHAESTTSA